MSSCHDRLFQRRSYPLPLTRKVADDPHWIVTNGSFADADRSEYQALNLKLFIGRLGVYPKRYKFETQWRSFRCLLLRKKKTFCKHILM